MTVPGAEVGPIECKTVVRALIFPNVYVTFSVGEALCKGLSLCGS